MSSPWPPRPWSAEPEQLLGYRKRNFNSQKPRAEAGRGLAGPGTQGLSSRRMAGTEERRSTVLPSYPCPRDPAPSEPHCTVPVPGTLCSLSRCSRGGTTGSQMAARGRRPRGWGRGETWPSEHAAPCHVGAAGDGGMSCGWRSWVRGCRLAAETRVGCRSRGGRHPLLSSWRFSLFGSDSGVSGKEPEDQQEAGLT